jgi:hypothetical protein
MKPTINISVPTPCHEKWEDFTPATGGRHCSSCDKVVVDFSKMSDSDIIEFFKQRNMGACGRFRPDQLRDYSLPQNEKRRRGWQHVWASLAGATLIMLSKETLAQERVGRVVVPTTWQQQPEYSDTVTVGKISVEGVVISKEDNMELPGVNVVVKGTVYGTVTDADGKFKLEDKVAAGDVLVFSFVGLTTQEVMITETNAASLRIEMDSDKLALGGIVVGGVQTTRTISLRRWWKRFKSLFRRHHFENQQSTVDNLKSTSYEFGHCQHSPPEPPVGETPTAQGVCSYALESKIKNR